MPPPCAVWPEGLRFFFKKCRPRAEPAPRPPAASLGGGASWGGGASYDGGASWDGGGGASWDGGASWAAQNGLTPAHYVEPPPAAAARHGGCGRQQCRREAPAGPGLRSGADWRMLKASARSVMCVCA